MFHMAKKTISEQPRINFSVDGDLRESFKRKCAGQGMTMKETLPKLIRLFNQGKVKVS